MKKVDHGCIEQGRHSMKTSMKLSTYGADKKKMRKYTVWKFKNPNGIVDFAVSGELQSADMDTIAFLFHFLVIMDATKNWMLYQRFPN